GNTKKDFAYITDLHYEHKLWHNELNFYRDEIKILQARLEEIVSKNTSNEVEMGVESFQNRFDLNRKHISEIKHRIKKHEKFLVNYAKDHPIAVDHVHFTDHTDIRENFERFRELYREMKTEFNRFAVKWM
ncbi:MAG: hypothetical protein KDC61_06310, partial [Saprospiraceae bacterium]|nr:hypothetical protein [Saprospiraceae bacterium]